MVEIWVPYGSVEVSFDIKQENLSQVVEAEPNKITQDELEVRLASVTSEAVLVLSGSASSQKVLHELLTKNRSVKKLLFSKSTGALTRRTAQEFGIPAELFRSDSVVATGATLDGSLAKIFAQLKEFPNLAVLSSSHYDPLFGLTTGTSDLISLNGELKSEAFRRSFVDLPCEIGRSEASQYAMHLIGENAPNVDLIQVLEKGVPVEVYYGDPESVRAQTLSVWPKLFGARIEGPKVEKLIFGCGGRENDRALSVALSRGFFNAVSGALSGGNSELKLCMVGECGQGLGAQAFTDYVTGRSEGPPFDSSSTRYVEGLEVLVSYFRVMKDLELSVMSTLPRIFVEKFGARPIKAARDAPSVLLTHGSRAKILVVPDSSSCHLAGWHP